jgi:hypothetical protein
MKIIEDSSITACLDQSWRTVSQIRSRLGVSIDQAGRLASALQRLTDAGQIERVEKETSAPKLRGHRIAGKLAIQFYRLRPRAETSAD